LSRKGKRTSRGAGHPPPFSIPRRAFFGNPTLITPSLSVILRAGEGIECIKYADYADDNRRARVMPWVAVPSPGFCRFRGESCSDSPLFWSRCWGSAVMASRTGVRNLSRRAVARLPSGKGQELVRRRVPRRLLPVVKPRRPSQPGRPKRPRRPSQPGRPKRPRPNGSNGSSSRRRSHRK
jgi:hypothetical protein